MSGTQRPVRITDTTLRDGSHAMSHQFTEEQVRAYLAKHPTFASPLHHPPHRKGIAGTAANIVFEVAPMIRQSGVNST